MKKYQVKSIAKEPFRLTEGTEDLGTLNYPNWYSTTKAEIQLTGQAEKFELKTPGFWKNNLELWKGDDCIISSKLGWNLGVTLSINETDYVLKVKNLGKGIFTLQDETDYELIRIDVNMDWIHAKADFTIEVLRNEELFAPEILLFLVHNCNYFLALSGNGSNTEGILAAIM